MIFDLISMLKRMEITVLIADEAFDGNSEEFELGNGNIRTQFIKYLSDGLIGFYSSGLGGTSDRALRIIKMRRTNHTRGPVPFQITNSGIKVLGKK
jgi:KaiC/GvpD/RAD55 family RecA-like ATPase